ncbi:MAG: hypothetical protein ACRC1M_03025 [Methanobacteriaceae archaeon]
MIYYLSPCDKGMYITKENKTVNLIECKRIIGKIDFAIELSSFEEALKYFELNKNENIQ